MRPAARTPELNSTKNERIYQALCDRLDRPVGHWPGRVSSFCPAHEDGKKSGNRSLTISRDHGLKCWAGCDFTSILAAFGLRPGDVLGAGRPARPTPHAARGVRTGARPV